MSWIIILLCFYRVDHIYIFLDISNQINFHGVLLYLSFSRKTYIIGLLSILNIYLVFICLIMTRPNNLGKYLEKMVITNIGSCCWWHFLYCFSLAVNECIQWIVSSNLICTLTCICCTHNYFSKLYFHYSFTKYEKQHVPNV